MSKTRATAEEIQTQIAAAMAEADQLKAKADAEGLTPEETAKLEELVAQIEQLQTELAAANTEQRYAAAKARMAEPTRSAPKIPAIHVRDSKRPSFAEGFSLWASARTAGADMSPDAYYKARSAGFDLNNTSIKVPCNYRGLNFKQRTIMSKGGAGSGLEYVYQTYSDKVVEYLTYSSPLLGLVGSETTGDGNNRTYFVVDDTSMISTFTSASGGTETAPTIPDTNLTTANVVIGCFDITSGYQKISFNELRDAYAAVGLEDKIAKANANSHARLIEKQVVQATGNGSTGVKGLQASSTELTDTSAWDQEALEGLYFSVPAQYRSNAVFLTHPDTYGDLFSALKDGNDRTLFDKSVDQGIEYDVLLGKKIIQSEWVAADRVLFFNPEFYMLRMVEGQIFQQFTEKFFPNVAWAGIMSFGGSWLGPASACKSLSLSDS